MILIPSVLKSQGGLTPAGSVNYKAHHKKNDGAGPTIFYNYSAYSYCPINIHTQFNIHIQFKIPAQ